MHTRAVRVFLVILVALSFMACQQMPKPKPFQEMTPKEKVSIAMAQYNKAYGQYQTQRAAAVEPLGEAEQKYFTEFKKILTGAWVAIGNYDTFVLSGMQPTAEVEAALEQAILKLSELLKGQVVE